jgi:hypothetical protein
LPQPAAWACALTRAIAAALLAARQSGFGTVRHGPFAISSKKSG